MIVRQEQLNTLSESATSDFENRVVAHLSKCFPAESEVLQEQGVREIIQYGMERAASYDVSAERDVCKYIDVMMVFGRDFDKDEDLPWASRILNDKVLNNPTARIDRLFTVAKEHGETTS